jgi:hypothetical protein
VYTWSRARHVPCNVNVHYCFHMSQTNPFHTVTPSLYKEKR